MLFIRGGKVRKAYSSARQISLVLCLVSAAAPALPRLVLNSLVTHPQISLGPICYISVPGSIPIKNC